MITDFVFFLGAFFVLVVLACPGCVMVELLERRRFATAGVFLGVIVVLCLIAAWAVHAAPPPGPLGPRHAWFAAQHSVSGAWCCNVADGHLLADDDWREDADHYEVRIDGAWHIIPATAIRDPRGGPNPTGRAIVWYAGSGDLIAIYCFAPGFQL